MTAVVREALTGFDWFVLTYFLVLSSGYLVLLVLAGVDVSQTIRRDPFAGHDDTFANPLTPAAAGDSRLTRTSLSQTAPRTSTRCTSASASGRQRGSLTGFRYSEQRAASALGWRRRGYPYEWSKVRSDGGWTHERR